MADEMRGLVQRCLEGHQPSILEFVRQFYGRVFGYCFRMLGHRQDAEDVTQETFARVFRHMRRWDPQRGRMEPWLMTIAGNRCRSRLAQRSRRPVVCSLDVPVPDNSEQHAAAGQLAEEMHLALRGLRSEYRTAFLLFHQHQLAYEEIAAAMNVPLGTIKTWVHRARREMVRRLTARGVVGESSSELPGIRSGHSRAFGRAS